MPLQSSRLIAAARPRAARAPQAEAWGIRSQVGHPAPGREPIPPLGKRRTTPDSVEMSDLRAFLAFRPTERFGGTRIAITLVRPKLTQTKGATMLRWALIFLVVALIAALFGFGGIAGAAAGIAKFIFFAF